MSLFHSHRWVYSYRFSEDDLGMSPKRHRICSTCGKLQREWINYFDRGWQDCLTQTRKREISEEVKASRKEFERLLREHDYEPAPSPADREEPGE